MAAPLKRVGKRASNPEALKFEQTKILEEVNKDQKGRSRRWCFFRNSKRLGSSCGVPFIAHSAVRLNGSTIFRRVTNKANIQVHSYYYSTNPIHYSSDFPSPLLYTGTSLRWYAQKRKLNWPVPILYFQITTMASDSCKERRAYLGWPFKGWDGNNEQATELLYYPGRMSDQVTLQTYSDYSRRTAFLAVGNKSISQSWPTRATGR